MFILLICLVISLLCLITNLSIVRQLILNFSYYSMIKKYEYTIDDIKSTSLEPFEDIEDVEDIEDIEDVADIEDINKSNINESYNYVISQKIDNVTYYKCLLKKIFG